MDEHLQHLEIVLEILREHKLYANKKKCSFVYPRVEYLGHIVFGRGVEVDPKNVRSIKQWPVPTSKRSEGISWASRVLQEICSKLWYNCSFFNPIALVGAFKWIDEAKLAFSKLQEAMMTLLVLALPNFSVT